MNKDDRKELTRAEALLSEAKEIIEALAGSLDERASNMGDFFQGGSPVLERLEAERDTAQEITDNLEDMLGSLDELQNGGGY